MPNDLPDNPYGSPQTDASGQVQPTSRRLTAGNVAWCIAVINLVSIMVLAIDSAIGHFMPLGLRDYIPIPTVVGRSIVLWAIFGVPITFIGMLTQSSRIKANVNWGFWCVVLFTAFVWLALFYYYAFLWNPYRWENHS